MKKALLAGISFTASALFAQPTPIGPPPQREERASLPVSAIKNFVTTTAQTKVNETNENLRRDGRLTRAALESVRILAKPSRAGTDTLNRPNSFYVRIPFMVTIKADIPATSDRHIGIPVDVNVFCDDWHTGGGKVVARARPGPASFEGGNILEDVINVGNLIDAGVRSAFTPPGPLTLPFNLTKCTTIGASDTGTETTSDDAVVWDEPGRVPPRVGGDAGVRPTIEVTFNRLKRLRARTHRGAVVYRDAEAVLLNAYANYSQSQKQLTMREGDDVALSLPTVRLDPGAFDKLVVIGTVEQPPNNPRDSAFRTAAKTQNYGPGTHILEIPKWYSRPPGPTNPKPTFVRVPGYALTYTVRYVDPGIVQP
jgi:hypothetical protein